MGVARAARAEIHGVEAACGEVGDVRPRLFRLHLEAAGDPKFLDERRAASDVGRRRVREDLEVTSDQLAHAGLGLGRRAIRRVAVVQDHVDASRNHVRRDAAADLRRGEHLAEHEPVDLDVTWLDIENRPQPLECHVDRVHAEPWSCGVRRTPFEDDAATRLPRHPSCKRVVRRLETDHELRLVDDRCPSKDAWQRVLIRSELLAWEEEQPEVVGEVDTVRPPRELDHHGQPALHVARSEADDRIVLGAGGEVSLCRNGVGVAREQHERFARPLRVQQRLAVGEDQLEWQCLLNVGGDCGLVPRLGRDVHQLERPLRQEGIELGSGHNRRQ